MSEMRMMESAQLRRVAVNCHILRRRARRKVEVKRKRGRNSEVQLRVEHDSGLVLRSGMHKVRSRRRTASLRRFAGDDYAGALDLGRLERWFVCVTQE